MKHYKVQIKERGNESILTPEYIGDVDMAYVENWFGVHNDDVEWYKIEVEEI